MSQMDIFKSRITSFLYKYAFAMDTLQSSFCLSLFFATHL